jgi:hypothetical protein
MCSYVVYQFDLSLLQGKCYFGSIHTKIKFTQQFLLKAQLIEIHFIV